MTKQSITKILLTILICMMGVNAFAHDIEVKNADGVPIYYNWNKNKTELIVSFQGSHFDSYSNEYSGNIVIPESVLFEGNTFQVTSIGTNAFSYCSDLTSVTIPQSVTSIGYWAFRDCSGLTSVNIPNSVKTIEDGVFFRCSCLTSITIPNSVTSIESDAFNGCSSLTTVTIPNSVISIGVETFYGCSSLASVTIGNSVISIGEMAFSECSGLTSVNIPNSVTSIRQWAFLNCSGLTSITIPNSVTTIEAGTFSGCSGLTSITIPNSVTYIGNKAFQGCSGLTSVTIPNSVTSIGEEAFVKTSSLTSVTIPNSVTSIGGGAFYGCSGLTSVNISDIAAWCNLVFNNMYSNPLFYANHLFMNGEEVKDLVIPNSVTSIGNYTFDTCVGLTSVTIPNSVTSIGERAFAFCMGLTSVTIPNSVTSIGDYAFYVCSGLTSMTIPNSVTSIGKQVFSNCRDLTSITIPNSVTSIGDYAFAYCSSLTSVTIPNSVTSIGEAAFYLCNNLTSITLGNSVTTIGDFAFQSCSGLTSISIPNSVTRIGVAAFTRCSSLTSITIGVQTPFAISENVFSSNTYTTATLIVPKGTKAAYQATESWKKFTNIIESGEEGDEPQTTDPVSYKLTYVVDGTTYKTYDIEPGATIAPEAEPTKEGYTFSGWSEIPQTMPDHDVTVTGSFTVNKYKLTYMVDGAEYKSYEMEYGASITPEAAPTKDGFIFSGWSNVPSTMPAKDVTITGSFTKGAYTLTYVVDGETYKTVGYDFGEAITPEAEPTREGYTFSGWSEIPQTMPGHNVTVTGSFSINTYTLTYMVDGEVYKSFDLQYGEEITPEAEPTKGGYTFSGWSEIPTTMPAYDVTVTGYFTSDATQYSLSITASGNGSVSYNGNAIKNKTKTFSLDEGSTATLTFTPDNGHQIKEVKVNGSVVTITDNQYTITGIDKDITVEVEFEAITYTLSITATGNGAASYKETVIRGETSTFTVTEGTSATISFTPDNGHRIKSVMVNGSAVSANKDQYTVSNINGDTTVEVEFEAITYTLSITATGNGAASFSETVIRDETSSFTVTEGTSATISFSPDKGYRIKSVMVNGSKVSLSNNQYTISNIKKNTTVEVEFEAITYTLSITAYGNGAATYDGTTIRSKTSSFTLKEGASATITFTPDEGSQIGAVKVNNEEVTLTNGQYTIENINANTKVSVEFEAIPHTLTITAKGNGTATYNGTTIREETSTFPVKGGGFAVITFSPDNGYVIKSVKVNDTPLTVSNDLYMIHTIQNITSDTSVEVEFESKAPSSYNLSITATGHGAASYLGLKIREKTSTYKVNAGKTVTISFIPEKGYMIKSVTVNNSDVTADVTNDSYTIDNISQDTDLKVVFGANALYKLTYMVDGEVYKVYELEEGAAITPEPEPKKEGYKFSGWSYIPSKMPAEDVTVVGSFTQEAVVKDDVSYAIEGDNASVTHVDNAQGDIKIESSVVINGQTYAVTSIAEGAFQGCTGMTSVEIPNTVTVIEQNAFNGCAGLMIIKIGNGVKEIGSKAFANIATSAARNRAGGTGLKVYCETEVLPSTAADAFENSPIENATLYVNDGLVSVYKVVVPWNKFGTIVGLSTGIWSITVDTENAHIYDIQGNRLDDVRKGVNIIRTRDGKTKKIMKK